MLPEAKNDTLLYISTYTGVEIYSYPKLKPVGELGVAEGFGLCSDKAGNVFVTVISPGLSAVYEYPHGGEQRIATFRPYTTNY
jgi:hypothetical protein